MNEADETALERVAVLAAMRVGQAPCRIKYTREKAGEVTFAGFYERNENGRWCAVAPREAIN